MWDFEGQQLSTLWEYSVLDDDCYCLFGAKFVYDPDRIFAVALIDDKDAWGLVVSLEGVVLQKIPDPLKFYHGNHSTFFCCIAIRVDDGVAITGNVDRSLQMYDTATGKHLYTFFHHSSSGFRCVAVHPHQNILVAGNKNGKVYVLKSN